VNFTFDTNILVYTLAPPADPRRALARDLIIRAMHSASSILLLQSLAEFSNVATRKFGIAAEAVRRRVVAWSNVIPVRAAVHEDVLGALIIVRDHKLPFWDALMCATAIRSGVDYLLTEDLQNGLLLGGMTIINPFSAGNEALTDRILPR
jgi:predicted nucleic acid-binding protein